jgi:hypothetical protein
LAMKKSDFGPLVQDRIYMTMEPADERSFYELGDNDYIKVFMGFWCQEPVSSEAIVVLPRNKYAMFQHLCGVKNLQLSYDYIYKTWVRRTELGACKSKIIQSSPNAVYLHPLSTCITMEISLTENRP